MTVSRMMLCIEIFSVINMGSYKYFESIVIVEYEYLNIFTGDDT